MALRSEFRPLCDLHHVAMERKMLEEDSDEVRSFHTCIRPDCTRVFRAGSGYSDRLGGEFDEERANVRPCPTCGAPLYLSSSNRVYKVETWECAQDGCGFREENSSPSGR